MLETAEIIEIAPEAVRTKRRGVSSARRMVGLVGAIIIFSVIIYGRWGLGVRFFRIPSSSMEPTLIPGDYIMTVKVDLEEEELQRGDIIVYDQSIVDGRGDWGPQYATKRLIAKGNDTVYIQDGIVHLNGKPLVEPYVKEIAVYDFPPLIDLIPEQIVVNYGYLFVLGDNRNNSDDSSVAYVERFTGKTRFKEAVPEEAVVGRMVLRYLPLRRFSFLSRIRLGDD